MNLIHYFQEANIPLDPQSWQKFAELLRLFQQKNQELNLSALKEDQDIIVKHFIDSLLPLLYFDFAQVRNIIDIGSGGGFPGLALAIYLPKANISVNDSVVKKVRAVEEIAQALELKNIFPLPGRAEDLGRDQKYREYFDLATLRAVALMPIALEYAAPLVRANGYIVLYKGNTYQEELFQAKNAIKQLGLILESVHLAELPAKMGERAILIFRKDKTIPPRFPRPIGMAKKQPL